MMTFQVTFQMTFGNASRLVNDRSFSICQMTHYLLIPCDLFTLNISNAQLAWSLFSVGS